MGRASALVCLIWKIRPSTAAREPYYNSIHPFATNSISNTRVLTKWLKKFKYEIREIQEILVHLEVSTYYLVEYEKSKQEKVRKRKKSMKTDLDHSNFATSLLPSADRSASNLLIYENRFFIRRKSSLYYLGNLLYIIRANLFVARICVKVEDPGPPEAFPVDTCGT